MLEVKERHKKDCESAWNSYHCYVDKHFGGPGNGCDDYRDADPEVLREKQRLESRARELQAEFKKTYGHEFHEDLEKNEVLEDLFIGSHMTVKDYISKNIEKYGAKKFAELLKKYWNVALADSFKDAILYELKVKDDYDTGIKTIQELADLLTGTEYMSELENDASIDVEELCKKMNWVIFFPYSDDNIEMRGAMYGEFEAWEGLTLKRVKKGELYPYKVDEENGEILYRKAKEETFVKTDKNAIEPDTTIIHAEWSPVNCLAEEETPSWRLSCTGANYATFEVRENGDLFAEAIIVDLNPSFREVVYKSPFIRDIIDKIKD